MYLKRETHRSEAWRRAVAALPCAWCMKEGPSQAAHRNEGKGMGLKAPDCWTFPLCNSCHAEFDQGKSLSKGMRRELADKWVLETVRKLAEDGVIKA